MMQASTVVSAPIIENIPAELTERPQWVCWRLEERKDKMTKIPYTPGTECRASSTDLMTWKTFDEAEKALRTDRYDGIGFVFSSGDPFAGVDLDKCRDPETGAVEAWAQKIIADASEGYVEVSPSGTGIHIIIEGRVRGGGIRRENIEMYSHGRFFTISGVLL